MITFLLIISGLWLIGSLLWNLVELEERCALSTLLLTLSAFVFAWVLILAIETEHPTALDVYRGTTRLSITYRDSIPIDSVVVFKDE